MLAFMARHAPWPLLLAALACAAKPPLGEPCNLTSQLPCTAWGLGCLELADGGTACAPPGEFQGCEAKEGCGPAWLSCAGPFPGLPSHFCLEACAATLDCKDPDTTCQDAGPGDFCIPDGCGPGSAPDGGAINGPRFFGPCDSAGRGDGTCLPYPSSPGQLPFGACLAAGTVDAGGGCLTDRTDGGAGTLCAPGLACVQPDAAKPGLCAPLCDPGLDGGPSCAAGTSCDGSLEAGFLAGICVSGG